MKEPVPLTGVRRIVYIELTAVGIAVSLLLIWTLRHLLLEVLVGLVLSVVAEPLVKLLVRARLRRSLAVVIVFIIGLALVLVVLFFLTVPIYGAASRFFHQLPSLVADVKANRGRFAHLLASLNLQTYLRSSSTKMTQILTNAASPAFLAAKTALSTIVDIATIFILSVFLSLEGPFIVKGILGLLSDDNAEKVKAVLEDTARSVTRYVLGNLVTSGFAGVVVGVSLAILGVPYAGVLALWVGLVDLLPLVGGLLAGIPTVLVAFLHSTVAGVITLGIFLAYQQLENHLLNPIVFSKAVNLNPLWILLAVLIGAQLAGIEGALLAIPVASALQVISRTLWRERETRRRERRIFMPSMNLEGNVRPPSAEPKPGSTQSALD